MAKKCARTFSIVVEKGKKSILDVTHLLPDALPRSVRVHATKHARALIVLDRPPPRRGVARKSGQNVHTNCMGKASRGAA